VLRAPGSPPVRFALASPRLRETPAGGRLRAALETAPFPFVEVGDDEMDALSDTERSQGVLLVAVEPDGSWRALEGVPRPRLLVLDGIQDPGNAGTLIRAAWAFAAHGVLALEGTVDPWSPKVVRAAAGALAHLPLLRVSWADACAWLGGRGVPLLVAEAGGRDVRAVGPMDSWALVVGNEGAGARAEVRAAAALAVGIPMAPAVESLNAAVAGAILLFVLAGASGGEVVGS
jgi:TrmH family RNA methyltransferase